MDAYPRRRTGKRSPRTWKARARQRWWNGLNHPPYTPPRAKRLRTKLCSGAPNKGGIKPAAAAAATDVSVLGVVGCHHSSHAHCCQRPPPCSSTSSYLWTAGASTVAVPMIPAPGPL
jgi:hypothetical protein